MNSFDEIYDKVYKGNIADHIAVKVPEKFTVMKLSLLHCFKSHINTGDYAWCYIDGVMTRIVCNGFEESAEGVSYPSFITSTIQKTEEGNKND
jgi:hypothetical protein